jgi:hypothetical protein
MFKKTDPYTFKKSCQLYLGPVEIGTLYLEYRITDYDDVNLNDLTVANPTQRSFMVHCTQKLMVSNPNYAGCQPLAQYSGAYIDYPVLLNPVIDITTSTATITLLDVSPKTINSKIQGTASTSNANGDTSSTVTSNTIGSSTSQTNSYDASVGVGSMFSAGGSYGNASTTSHDQSATSGTDSGRSGNSESSDTDSMSLKDWGAYCYIQPGTQSPSWIFGQEYPWDVIQFNQPNTAVANWGSQISLFVPTVVAQRLWDGAALVPPSQLSVLGVNFVTKAVWLVVLENSAPDTITFQHTIDYFAATHSTDSGEVFIFMDPTGTSLSVNSPDLLTTVLNLPVMALDPIGKNSTVAATGFIFSKFIVAPATSGSAYSRFKIETTTNDLIILETTATTPTSNMGFQVPDTCLPAIFGSGCSALQFTMYFKILDVINDYSLYIKHWIVETNQETNGVNLSIQINNATVPINKYVTATEAEGGENNVSMISLRNTDFSSNDYHDYLQLGLNSVQITITPMVASAESTYNIRAISIERD